MIRYCLSVAPLSNVDIALFAIAVTFNPTFLPVQCRFINFGIKSWFRLQQPLKILVWWSISLKNDDILFFPVTTSNLKRDNVSCTIVTLRMEHYQNVKSLYSRMAVENTCLQCDKSLGSPSNADIAVLTIGRTFNIFFLPHTWAYHIFLPI